MKLNAYCLLAVPPALWIGTFFPPAPAADGSAVSPVLPAGAVSNCATGCRAVPPQAAPETPEILRALDAFGALPLDATASELDVLLFHGAATREILAARPALLLTPLPDEHRRFLERELERRTAYLEVRLIAKDGGLPLHLPPTPFELGVKGHVHAPTEGALGSPEVSGTVQRVSADHLWVRL